MPSLTRLHPLRVVVLSRMKQPFARILSFQEK
jgi:hypothetical protein